MYQKLNQEALDKLMEIGIHEFAEKGFEKAKMSDIAKKSDLSVGVVYKYFDGKDGFFLHCVKYSMIHLGETLDMIEFTSESLTENLELILRRMLDYVHTRKDHLILYNEITAGSCKKFIDELAEEIEHATAQTYSQLFDQAYKSGKVRQDINPALFAFFFDNLLMMIHFSLSCDYYKKRMSYYCGEEPDEEILIQELLKFLIGALGINC